MTDPTPPPIDTIALVRDLIFSSKVSAAARLSGVRERVKIVRDPAALATLDARQLIVDLNADGTLDAAVAWKARTGGTVTGFVAHVDGDAIAKAKALGIDRVITNGGFSANVGSIVAGN